MKTNCYAKTVRNCEVCTDKPMQIKLYKYAGFECLGNNLCKHCDFLRFLKPTECLFLLVNGSSGYLKFGVWVCFSKHCLTNLQST